MNRGRYYFDIEANGLLDDSTVDYSASPWKLRDNFTVHCIVATNIDTLETVTFVQNECYLKFKAWVIENVNEVVSHNGINYDMLVCKVAFNMDYSVTPDTWCGKPVIIHDTLVLSKVLNPDRRGHSIEYFGKILGFPKIDWRAKAVELGLIAWNAPKGAEFHTFHPEMVSYCMTPDHKVLSKDTLSWVEIGSLEVGDEILGFDENGPNRKYKTAKVVSTKRQTQPVFKVTLESGKQFKCTAEHKWLVSTSRGKSSIGIGTFRWVETKNLRAGGKYSSKITRLVDMWEDENSFEAGWVSGMYDGEGCLSKSRFNIGIAQRPTRTLEKLEGLLTKFGVAYSKRYTKKGSDCHSMNVLGSSPERLKFLGRFKPKRLMDKFSFEDMGRIEFKNPAIRDAVVCVEPMGVQEIVVLETSTSTFICEGYPMHNCKQDVLVGVKTFHYLMQEWGDWNWQDAYDLEKGIAEIITRQAHRGFKFDSELALSNVKELDELMLERKQRVEPNLPMKPMGKTKAKEYIPGKEQFKKNGEPNANVIKWCEKHGGKIEHRENDGYYTTLYGKEYKLPIPQEPIISTEPSHIDDTTFIKGVLVEMGWKPTQYKERDLTVDTKKQKLSEDKFVAVIDRYTKQTLDSPFCKDRCAKLGVSPKMLLDKLKKHKLNKPLKVYTNPTFTVGQEKEIDPELEKLAEDFPYVQDIIEYLTYKHRRNSILGGGFDPEEDDEDDFESGFIPNVRKDGRIPTPADSCGCATGRMQHRVVANIARVTSLYGANMRALFGVDTDLCYQHAYDFASLEARIESHYCWRYDETKEYCNSLLLEKPNDVHSVTARKISEMLQKEFGRSPAKSVKYACVPMHTLALTRGGWKNYYQLEIGDEVLGYDETTQTKKWTKVLGKFKQLDDVVEFGNSWFKLQATKDHRWFVKQRREFSTGKPNFSIRKAVHEVRTTSELNSESNIIMNAPMDVSQDVVVSGAALVMDGKYSKDWVARVLEMSHSERVAFLEGFMIADGYHGNGRWNWSQRIGNICEAAIIATYLVHDKCIQIRDVVNATNPMKNVLLSKKSHRTLQTGSFRYVGEQEVWCIETELGSWVMRQGDVITITGNCSYGAQAARIAKTVGCSLEDGQTVFDAFWAAAAPLAALKEALTRYWETVGEKKFVLGLDGRKIMTRSQHALLNSLFQSAGVICAKRTMFIQDRLMKDGGYSVDFWKEDWKNKQYIQQLIGYHDEAQSEITKGLVQWKKFATKEDAKAFQAENPLWAGPIENEKGFFMGHSVADDILHEAIEQTNKHYKLKVPLAVEPQYGRNWKECH